MAIKQAFAGRGAPGSTGAMLRTQRVRDYLTAGGLIVSAVTIAVLLILRPWGERNQLTYAEIAPIRDQVWIGVTIDSLAIAALGICFGLVVCRTVQAKGARLAEVGAVLAMTGGILWGMGMYFFASFAWYATAAAVLNETAGTALMDAALSDPMRGMIFVQVGFFAQGLGVLLLSAALMRSRAVPLWVPIGIVLAWLSSFFLPTAALDYMQALQMLLIAAVGVLLLSRRGR